MVLQEVPEGIKIEIVAVNPEGINTGKHRNRYRGDRDHSGNGYKRSNSQS